MFHHYYYRVNENFTETRAAFHLKPALWQGACPPRHQAGARDVGASKICRGRQVPQSLAASLARTFGVARLHIRESARVHAGARTLGADNYLHHGSSLGTPAWSWDSHG